MHVAIVGAGALGRVYGVRLATKGDAEVTFVVRTPPPPGSGPLSIERVDGARDAIAIDAPVFATDIPASAEVVLVAVRGEQLDAALDARLDATEAPLVILTPMMPGDAERLEARYGARLRPAMAGVVAYVGDGGRCRYWLPRSATTLIDSTAGLLAELRNLAAALQKAGIATRLEPHVQEMNLATTVAIVPAAMGIDAAGSIQALLDEREILGLVIAAVKEGLSLGGRVGKGASWIGLLTPFIGPRMLRVGIALGKSRAPEAMAYVESHFGRKLHAQNVAMGRAVIELARRKGSPSGAIERLLARLEGAPPT